jgi:hypothetical protein
MCEALLADLRIDGNTATPIINVPLSWDDIPTSLHVDVPDTATEAVRVRPPIVDLRLQHTNRYATVVSCGFLLPLAL